MTKRPNPATMARVLTLQIEATVAELIELEQYLAKSALAEIAGIGSLTIADRIGQRVVKAAVELAKEHDR